MADDLFVLERTFDPMAVESQLEAFLASLPDTPYPNIGLSDPNRKWRVISAYQKSIRRTDPDTAVKTAVAVFRHDPAYFLRRNAVVMFEDIGLANPMLCAASLKLAGKLKLIKGTEAGVQLIANFARAAALSKKDRSLCWTAVSSFFPQSTFAARNELAVASAECPESLLQSVLDTTMPVIYRYQALMSLFGKITHKHDTAETPKAHSNRALFQQCLTNMELPPAIEYSVLTGARMGLEGLPFAMPFLYKMAEFAAIEPMEVPPVETIEGLPSYAYDQHVMEGRIALSRFTYRTGVKQWLLDNGFSTGEWKVTGVLAFEWEGGNVLTQWNAFPSSVALLHTARNAHFESVGVTPEQGLEGRDILLNNLDKLNECRRSIVEKK